MIIFEIPQIKKFNLNRYSLIIGSLLPDLIDKPLLFLGLGAGRFLSHSLIAIFIIFLIVFGITKGNKKVSLPLLIGMIFHVILDLPNVPLLFPFISYEYIIIEDPFSVWITALLTNPLVIITEITGILFIVFILIRNKLYHIKDITDYLKGINQTLIKSTKEKDINI
ncbi:MAG: metal-dependent hydrolase [Promethearchaeota archaeon]